MEIKLEETALVYIVKQGERLPVIYQDGKLLRGVRAITIRSHVDAAFVTVYTSVAGFEKAKNKHDFFATLYPNPTLDYTVQMSVPCFTLTPFDDDVYMVDLDKEK